MMHCLARRFLALLFLLGIFPFGAPCLKGEDTAAVDFFERKIRPVLVEHCYECHAAESDVIQGGLRLDFREALLTGGDSGPAIVPGKPQESLLLAALRYEEFEMPPSGKLPAEVLRDFEDWIQAGAADPRHEKPAAANTTPNHEPLLSQAALAHWAFQPPQASPPTVQGHYPAGNRIDGFIVGRLKSAGLEPNERASREVLIRRLAFDLLGVPPTPDEVRRFVDNDEPDAYARLVDRFLSDPRHAERWTRLWLDIARYAEDQAHIVGNNDSLTYPNAYLYRDWVIDALANDMPYDEFIRRQLAADAIGALDTDELVALGFLGLGPKYYRRNDPAVMADEWEDRVDTVTRGLLGLTVACARCHDHKYDPIPTTDYYALAGVFAGTEMFNLPLREDVEQQNGQAKKPQDALHIVRDLQPKDLRVMVRGDVNNLGPVVPRGFLTALRKEQPQNFEQGSGRLDLAEAIIDPQNPLTARVIVNRVWGQLMGAPLVSTPSNFGRLGAKPTHPELLDDLAVRFMEQDWSLKWLQREIVLSETYQQSSRLDEQKYAVDPDNQLRWRMPRRRLSAEAYRDALLAVAGRLEQTIGGPSMQPDDAESCRRTLYSEVSRLDLNPLLARFDFPDPNAHSPRRHETTTPLQKLFLLNSPFLVRQASALGQRLESELELDTTQERIEFLYRLLFARPVSAEERELASRYLETGGDDAWTQYVQALLISNEMFMID